jgi:hypothetical protein
MYRVIEMKYDIGEVTEEAREYATQRSLIVVGIPKAKINDVLRAQSLWKLN